jgi:uroporphyrinogen-III synthase
LAAGLVHALDEARLELLFVPATEINFAMEPNELPDLGNFAWIAFTSANGVRGFANLLKSSGRIIPSICRVACLGEATAIVARRELLSDVDFIGTRAHGSGFAEALIEHVGSTRPMNLLHPCAREALPDFAEHCRDHGLHVTSLVVYETLPVPTTELQAELNALENWDAVVFYAPSAVNSFVAAWPNRHDYEVIAIGATTARALTEFHFEHVWTCESPTPTHLAAAINDALAFRAEQRLESLQNETTADLATERLD